MNVQKSNGNCGACNNKCGPGGSCNAGVCSCGTGLSACGGTAGDAGTDAGDGGSSVVKCVDLKTDPQNCGACGTVCEGGTCSASACTSGA